VEGVGGVAARVFSPAARVGVRGSPELNKKSRSLYVDCMYHLIAVDDSLSPRWFVTQFVFGLRDDIHCSVRLQAPSSITRAASLPRI
jgi:hypothetical protein